MKEQPMWTERQIPVLSDWLIAYLAIIGNFVLSILPGFIGVMIDHGGFSDRYAGLVASANLAGVAAGALLATLLLGRAAHRPVVLIGLLAMLGSEWACAAASTPETLIVLRSYSGMAGGVASASCLGLIARLPGAQRIYAVSIMLQFLFGAAGLTLLPVMVHLMGLAGLSVLVTLVVCFGIAALLLLPPMSLTRPASAQSHAGWPAISTLGAVLAAYALFQCAMFTSWSFMDRLGLQAGLSESATGATLGIGGSAFGMVGAIAAALLGARFGTFRPALAGCFLVAASLALILWQNSAPIYVFGNILFGVAWAFATPYFIMRQAEMDGEGRVAAFGSFVALIGIAAGPALASAVVTAVDYMPSLMLGIALLVPSLALFRFATASGAQK